MCCLSLWVVLSANDRWLFVASMRPLWDGDGVLQIRIGGIEECKCLLTRKKETVTYETMLFFGYFFRLAGSWLNGLISKCVWHGIIVICVSPQQQPRNTRSGARCSRRKSAVRTASHRLSHRNFISGERWEFFFDKVSHRLLSGMTTAGDWYSFAICFQ